MIAVSRSHRLTMLKGYLLAKITDQGRRNAASAVWKERVAADKEVRASLPALWRRKLGRRQEPPQAGVEPARGCGSCSPFSIDTFSNTHHGVTATDCVPEVQAPAELHTRTEMVSVTVPGFMPTVIWLELTMVGVLPVFHFPLLGGTVHSNCT